MTDDLRFKIWISLFIAVIMFGIVVVFHQTAEEVLQSYTFRDSSLVLGGTRVSDSSIVWRLRDPSNNPKLSGSFFASDSLVGVHILSFDDNPMREPEHTGCTDDTLSYPMNSWVDMRSEKLRNEKPYITGASKRYLRLDTLSQDSVDILSDSSSLPNLCISCSAESIKSHNRRLLQKHITTPEFQIPTFRFITVELLDRYLQWCDRDSFPSPIGWFSIDTLGNYNWDKVTDTCWTKWQTPSLIGFRDWLKGEMK